MTSNGTFLAVSSLDFDGWSGYAQQARLQLPLLLTHRGPMPWVIGLVMLPLLIVLLNIFSQLVLPKDISRPPQVFHWLPIVGSVIEYGNDPIGFLSKCRQKYGDVFTFILLGRRVTVALGPRGNNFVAGGKHADMNAEDAYKHFTTPVFGKDVVFDVPNSIFMEQKKFIKSGLTVENFRAYIGMMEEEISSFLETDAAFRIYQFSDEPGEWAQFQPLRTLSEITILTASRTLQGKEVRASLDKTFAQRYADLDGGFTPLNFLFPNLPLETYRRRDRAHKAMSDFYVDLIRKRQAGESGADESSHDIIATLLQQKYKDGHDLPEHEIAHIMIALLMAGQHTSAATGTWGLLRIASRPDIADALLKEQTEHCGTDKPGAFRTPTYEELRSLPILDAVIRETLRVHPPIHSIFRKVTTDIVVPPTLAAPRASSTSPSKKSRDGDGTYVVPRGHYVLSSPALSQVDPTIWRDARTWDPARWYDKDGVAAQAYRTYEDANGEKVDFGFGAVSKGTESPYQPFGAGRHRCIGEQFAYLQLGMVISTIVRKIELRLDVPFPHNNYHSMITLPLDPCNISYRRRRFD